MRHQLILTTGISVCAIVIAGCAGTRFEDGARTLPRQQVFVQRPNVHVKPAPASRYRRGGLVITDPRPVANAAAEERARQASITANPVINPAPPPDVQGVARAPLPEPNTDAVQREPSVRRQVASVGNPVTNTRSTLSALTKRDLLGNWKLAFGGRNCLIGFSLTQWQGGNRAFTRNCTATALKSVSSWRLQGEQLVLRNAQGETVATMSRSSQTRFSGQTNGGRAVRFWR